MRGQNIRTKPTNIYEYEGCAKLFTTHRELVAYISIVVWAIYEYDWVPVLETVSRHNDHTDPEDHKQEQEKHVPALAVVRLIGPRFKKVLPISCVIQWVGLPSVVQLRLGNLILIRFQFSNHDVRPLFARTLAAGEMERQQTD